MSRSLREQTLEQEVARLRRELAVTSHMHMATITTLVYYCGGEVTLSAQDYTNAQGVLLTVQIDAPAQTQTFRTRRPGRDGGDELARGGLLPPDVTQEGGAINGHTESDHTV